MQHWPWYLLIDECFLDLSGLPEATAQARATRDQILRWIDIPTCVGIAPTKTLAKLANHIAKSAERKPGSYPARLAQVCNLAELSDRQREWLYQRTPVGEVWGVGPRIVRQLGEAGITTVLDLVRLDPATVKSRWSVVLERTVRELRGIPCIGLDDAPAPKQQIAVTRSFGQRVTGLAELQQAVTDFASRAAQKLRAQDSQASAVLVFIRTSPFSPQAPQYGRSITVPLRLPSSDTLQVVSAALAGLDRIYRAGYDYAKAGVMLLDLQPATQGQQVLELGDDAVVHERRQARLMRALDAVNDRFGRGTLTLGSAGLCQEARPRWTMRQERRTPRYTTCWDELLTVSA